MPNDSALAAVRAAAQTAAATTAQPAADAGKPNTAEAKQPEATTAAAPSGSQPAPAQPGFSNEQLASAKAGGHKEGAKAERQRLSAIMKLDSATDRQSQALALALDTDVTVDQADAVLKSSPAGGKASSFEAAMARLGNPDLGTNAAVAGPAKTKPALDHAGIFQRFNNPGGK